jgi:uncharacterized protein (TIGR03086 family)
MDHLDLLRAARDDFRERLDAVGPDQWSQPTPCDDWTVRELVCHLVRGNVMSELRLAGTSREDTLAAMAAVDPGEDVVGAFDDSAQRQEKAFAAPDALVRTCHHPVGDIPCSQLLGFRVGDMMLHAWDLARAIGADESLRPEVVSAVWESLSPLAPVIGEIGLFGSGPSGSVPEDAPLQVRVLDLSGRRP